jgi:tyrosine-protein kinase Etk/Wzc
VKFHEALFELLSKQNESARIDESYAAPIELVDAAVLPDEKSWPSRRFFLLIGLIAGTLLAVGIVCLRAAQPVSRFRRFLRDEPSASDRTRG